MDTRQLAKQKFLELRANGANPTARYMSKNSFQWWGKNVTLDTMKDWMVRDQWRSAIVELVKSEQNLKYMQLFEEAIDRADESVNPVVLAHTSRALVTLMNTVPREMNVEYKDRIENVSNMIHAALYKYSLGTVTASAFSSLIKTYSAMTNIIKSESIVESDGHDADAILMGLADAEEVDGHGDSRVPQMQG